MSLFGQKTLEKYENRIFIFVGTKDNNVFYGIYMLCKISIKMIFLDQNFMNTDTKYEQKIGHCKIIFIK
jgi:hypothetical protein